MLYYIFLLQSYLSEWCLPWLSLQFLMIQIGVSLVMFFCRCDALLSDFSGAAWELSHFCRCSWPNSLFITMIHTFCIHFLCMYRMIHFGMWSWRVYDMTPTYCRLVCQRFVHFLCLCGSNTHWGYWIWMPWCCYDYGRITCATEALPRLVWLTTLCSGKVTLDSHGTEVIWVCYCSDNALKVVLCWGIW